jgi:hypothetical protein
VSVAAPPTTLAHAVHVASEHFSFCPEVEFPVPGSEDPLVVKRLDEEAELLAYTLGVEPDWDSEFLQYASVIVDCQLWRFWWD